ncbi:MAG TPA: hypothetical protein VL486_08680 [Verrucomicrobiae bacterium]|nr:hypothetical protein [Verrucomicrobiae bacterium]
MNEKTFQAVVKYGSVVLAVCLILNIWVVMRHVEVYRDATRADAQFQQLAVQQQVFQSLLQDFAARATTDPQIAEIFKQAQAMANVPAGAAPMESNQPTEPMR